MLVLDTDHFSEWARGLAVGARLRVRLQSANRDLAVTIATIEEQIRGRLAEISRHADPHRQILAYTRMQQHVEAFATWIILPWDSDSADLFLNFRRQGVRIGTMDLKIACIAIAHEATLLTRNAADFSKVPGLRFENWLG